MRVPGGGASCLGVGRPGSGALRPPANSSLRACGRGSLPTGCGCGDCGRGDPSPTPQRALLRAGFARCGGGMRVPGGGASCLGVGRPGSGALPPPTTRLFGRAARAHYPLAGVRAWGPVTNPTARALASWLCALWGRHECGRGGAPLAWVWGFRGRALSHSNHLSFQACGRGEQPTGCGCGVCGCGDVSPTPQRALLRAGFARCGGGTRAPGGAPLAWVWGVRVRALPHPRPVVLSGVRPGPTTHWLWVGGLRAWGPITNPTARALASWLCALWGRHEGVHGGRLLPGCGASGVGRSPTPNNSSFQACGRGPLPTGCGCGGCGRRDPSPTPQRAFSRAVGAARGRPGGAPLAWVWDVRGRALSHPRPLVLAGVRPGPTTHWLWVRGVRAWGPVTNPTARALARCGGGTRAPGGGASCLGVGRPKRALSHPRPLVLSGVRPGPASHWPWVPCAGLRAWLSLAPSPVPRFVVCCAGFPGSRHPVAVVAWHLSSTYDFSICFFPKFKKSAKRGFLRKMTYFFGFYGPKIGGGVLLPGFCPKISKTLKIGLFWSIFACSGLVLQNSVAHQCTYL